MLLLEVALLLHPGEENLLEAVLLAGPHSVSVVHAVGSRLQDDLRIRPKGRIGRRNRLLRVRPERKLRAVEGLEGHATDALRGSSGHLDHPAVVESHLPRVRPLCRELQELRQVGVEPLVDIKYCFG